MYLINDSIALPCYQKQDNIGDFFWLHQQRLVKVRASPANSRMSARIRISVIPPRFAIKTLSILKFPGLLFSAKLSIEPNGPPNFGLSPRSPGTEVLAS